MPDGALSIVLIGFMGTGKSSVGRLLAHARGWPLFDTDEMVAASSGMSVREIFSRLGEEHFRQAEADVLNSIEQNEPAVIVTGGGAVLRRENIARLRQLGTVICLRLDFETLAARLASGDDRPLLQTADRRDTIARLLEQRKELYEAAADLIVNTTGLTPEEVACRIIDELQNSR